MSAHRNGLPESIGAVLGSDGLFAPEEQVVSETLVTETTTDALTEFRQQNMLLARLVLEHGPSSFPVLRQQDRLNQAGEKLDQSRKQ